MSIRQQLVDALKTRLELIHVGHVFTLPDGSYTCATTPLGVYPWRKVPFSVAQCPAIAFWDTADDITTGPSTQHEHQLKIGIECHIAGSSAITTARDIMADILAALESDRKWGGLARWTDVIDATPDVNQAGDVIAGVSINITIVYRTPYGRM